MTQNCNFFVLLKLSWKTLHYILSIESWLVNNWTCDHYNYISIIPLKNKQKRSILLKIEKIKDVAFLLMSFNVWLLMHISSIGLEAKAEVLSDLTQS